MKNSNRFKLGILMILFIGFQKLVAQPQFVIQDKVVFMTGGSNQEKAVAAQPNQKQQNSGVVIQDTIVFATSESSSGTPQVIKLDSIHKKLLALKKGRYEKANVFTWSNPHPTTSTNIEGYNILIIAPNLNKILAEIRFVRQKTNVWIDEKFNSSKNATDVKSVVYSEANRKATLETFSGYKFSLSINAQTGKIDVMPVLKAQVTDLHAASNAEVHIYKTGKLY